MGGGLSGTHPNVTSSPPPRLQLDFLPPRNLMALTAGTLEIRQKSNTIRHVPGTQSTPTSPLSHKAEPQGRQHVLLPTELPHCCYGSFPLFSASRCILMCRCAGDAWGSLEKLFKSSRASLANGQMKGKRKKKEKKGGCESYGFKIH